MGLPIIGVQAVVENVQKFVKDIDAVNKAIDENSKTTEKGTKSFNPFSKALDDASKTVKTALTNFSSFAKESLPFGDVIGGFADKLIALPVPVLAAAAAVAFLGKAFLDLGQRGAGLVGLAQTFDNVTASVGITSQALLIDLRKASAGTISDFALIEKANIALSGATGKLGEALGKGLPQLLQIARIQAKATGKDIDYIFGSLVEGIRKTSPLRIDNAQLIIKTTAAEEAYAQSVGKTAQQLTVEEKGIAILNATLEAGNAAIAQAGNIQETNAEKMARAQATVTNALDGLAVAVQPAYGTLLDAQQKVLDIFGQLANAIGPIFGGILSIITNIIGTIVDVVTSIAQPFIDAFSSVAPYIALVFQTVANIIGGVGKIISDVVGGIVKFLSDVGKNFFGLDLKNLGPQLFNGAAAAFGSFANGILAVANQLIFPAVIGIAKFIADFLIGFSPPKKGPLSKIDEGGANVMSSWLDGFTGVALDPVEQVAAEVNAALGDIGRESLKQVNTRLAQLDKALLPFQNRLDIVKANFEALAEPAKQALDAIDRQEQQLQEALAQGDPAAAERLRLLDQQRDAIQGQLDAQQSIVDRAQIQLALAKAQQAPERALLNIRQAYLNALAKRGAKKTAPANTGGTTAPEKRGKGAGEIPATGGTGITTPDTGMPSVLDLIGGQGAVDEAAQGLSDAFMGAIDQTGLQDFAQNSLDLGTQIDRIKGADVGAKIKDKFKGLTDAFDPNNPDSIPAKVLGFINTLTGDESTPGSIASFFANIPGNIQNALSTLTADASTPGSVANIFATLPTKISGALTTLTADASTPGSIANFFATIPTKITDALATITAGADTPGSLAATFAGIGDTFTNAIPTIQTVLSGALDLLFGPETPGSPINAILTTITMLTGDSSIQGSVASFFATLPQNVGNAASGLFDSLLTNVFNPVVTFLTGSGPGTLSGAIDTVVQFFTDLPGRIIIALQYMGISLYTSFVLPVINAINSLISFVEQGVRGFIDSIASFLQGIADSLGAVTPQFLLDAISGLKAAGESVNFGRISTELPAILQPPGGATGGMFSKGYAIYGEKGPELAYNATKTGIIPHELTSVLMNLSNILAQPQPLPVYGGDTYNNSNSTMNVTMNGVQGANDAVRRFSMLKAGS